VKPSSRWLLIFGAAIGFLIIVAIVLVFTMAKPENTSLLPEDTPEGTVQRYLLAIEDKDYAIAYSYLSFPSDNKISYEKWKESFSWYREKNETKVTLGKSEVTGNEANVDVTVDVFRPSGPFDNPVYTHHTTFSLKKEGASWKITSPTYAGWFY
jgi:hypothetical protein